MVVCLANKIGDGRVFAVDLFAGIMNNLKKALTWDRFVRTVVIKADLRRFDFFKDNFVDLITAYDTLSVIDQYTPDGTPYVLNEARRVLKPGGWFVVVDHEPVESIEPLDKAEEVEVRWWKVHMDVEKALGKSSGTEEMKEVEEDGAEYGMREFPRYVIYARNSLTSPKTLKPLQLRDLYHTVRRRDLLL